MNLRLEEPRVKFPASMRIVSQSTFYILQNENILKGWRKGVSAAMTVWGWVEARLWPIYSAAMIISIVNMIAVSSEKQIMADHYFGSATNPLSEDKETLLQESKKLFNEEVTLAIKEKVWQLPEGSFMREYADRHRTL